MNLKIEWDLTGPLSHRPTKEALIILCDNATDLKQLAMDIPKIRGLATYRGSRHVAVHESVKMLDGTAVLSATRFAIVTEEVKNG